MTFVYQENNELALPEAWSVRAENTHLNMNKGVLLLMATVTIITNLQAQYNQRLLP